MAILFTDLIPANKDLIEKSTLHHGRSLYKKTETEEKDTQSKKEGVISQIPLESSLELELAKVRYTQEEIEKTTQERKRRMQLSQQMKANSWSKKIKSKSYRKARREEKQRKEAEKIQINMLEDPIEGTTTEEAQKKEEVPEIVKAHEAAYNFIRSNINPVPVSIEQAHTQTLPKKDLDNLNPKKDRGATLPGIESLLEVDKDDFISEKTTVEDSDKPWEKEEVLLGWNTWGGASVEPVKKISNTNRITRTGVEIRKRKDFAVSHVIFNEKSHLTRNPKYGINKLPYGYKSKEEYSELMDFPIDHTHQPVAILNKLIKAEREKKTHL